MQFGLNLGPRTAQPVGSPLIPQGPSQDSRSPQQAIPASLPSVMLPMKGASPVAIPYAQSGGAYPRPASAGGIMGMQGLGAMGAVAAASQEAQYNAEKQQPQLTGLAGYVKRCWTLAKQAKQIPERQMLDALRARRGEYTTEQMQQLAAQGGSQIYMMIMATKARGASALIRDVTVGTGADKGWTLAPTPVPDLPEDVTKAIIEGVAGEIMAVEQAQGIPVDPKVIAQRLKEVRDDVEYMLEEEAKKRVERMEKKMEDQLTEGGYLDAMNEFIDDLTTFKTAFIKGPIIRRKPKLQWVRQADGTMKADVATVIVKEWKRIDPLMIYPAPWSSHIQDAWLIERHKLTRGALTSMIGVDSYSEAAIRKVLELHQQGFSDWLQVDSERANIEGKDQSAYQSSDTIDALQFMGPISGQMLIDWGMNKAQIPDPAKEYNADVWMIGPEIIKAALNSDPLGRRCYYATSYEPVPGTFWGNSLFDLIRDCIDMCNSAARALANNLGIASGPQVGVNVDRLPAGENITAMYPWKIWQFTSDPMGNNSAQKALEFFNPQSNAQELMSVFNTFSTLADEYAGIPRYMTGQEGTPGAGRTASGLSMMIGNASKLIKQTVGYVDTDITTKLLEMLYYYNMMYEQDPDLKGDVDIRARGVLSLIQKETAQQQQAAFLNATNNPTDIQIMGADGRAYLLREQAKRLDVDADKVVPSLAAMKRRQTLQMVAMQQAAATGGGQGATAPAGAPQPTGPPGMQQAAPTGNGQQLMNGAPVTDLHSPQPQQ